MKSFKTLAEELDRSTKIQETTKRKSKRIQEAKKDPVEYIRAAGYVIKDEDVTRNGVELEFYKKKDAMNAKDDLDSVPEFSDYDIIFDGLRSLEIVEN